jgi:hypothetical protein
MKNDLAVHSADAFVSFAKKTYDYPGNQLEDKTKVMLALRQQIGETKDAKDMIENLIHKLSFALFCSDYFIVFR